MTDEEFEQFRAFAFLNEVKNKFLQQFGIRWRNALAYSMQTAFSRTLSQLMVSQFIIMLLLIYNLFFFP